MPSYYLLLDAAFFQTVLRPGLAAAWRERCFEPCRALAGALLDRAADYLARYHVAEEPLLARALAGMAFDRALWRAVAGEALLFAADAIPEIQTCPETLTRLLAPGQPLDASRDQFVSIQQAHFGSRDLTFGSAIYRPDDAGLNDPADVGRLRLYLDAVDPECWEASQLAAFSDEEECVEELEMARDWFPALRDLYRQADTDGKVIVYERL
jgi:hypothetical protein